ncbi:hypothetical protein AYO46_00735 [Betaproteobacteria bacterium SCGC AG-212-J23]|nr:hypothetical protein AYO46_00735 [Betaproteobacteria bacterium SCGC AG-212-J23]
MTPATNSPNAAKRFGRRVWDALVSTLEAVARPFAFSVLWCIGTAAFGLLSIWFSLYLAPKVLKDFHPSLTTFLNEGAFVPFLIAVIAAVTVDYHLRKKADNLKTYTFVETMATLAAPALWLFYVALVYGLAFERDKTVLNLQGYQDLQLQLVYGTAVLALTIKMFYFR